MGKKRLKSKHPFYDKWAEMRKRCRKAWNKDYKYYGARGIDVCDEWHDDFWSYVDYIEALPHAYEEGRTTDRIDNDKGYFPGNIRWATWKQQALNRRKPSREGGKRWGKGYTKVPRLNKKPYQVQPVLGGKQVYGGCYATEEEAKARVAEMIKEYEESEK